MNNLVKLSPYSQTFYDGWCANPDRSDYNIVSDQELWGEFDRKRLEAALKRFSKDFIILHSKIQNIQEQLYWVEEDDLCISLDYFKTPLTEKELLQYVQQPFNLATGPLIRIGLISLGPGHFRLLLVIHHIIMDGAKVDYFIDNLSGYYNDEQHKGCYTLETQHQKFNELYNKFDNLKLDSQTAQTFWESRLQDVSGVDLRFLEPFKSRRINEQELHQNSFAEYRFFFDATVVHRFQRLKKQYALTPYLFGQAVFAVLVHQYTGQDEFAICYPVSVKEGMHFIYGVHINVNVIPFRLNGNLSILDILQNIKTQLKEIKQGNFHYHPFEQVLTRIKNKSVLDVGYIQTNLRDTPFHFDGINTVKINHDLNIDLLCRLLVEQELKDGAISYRVRYDKRYIDSTLLLSFVEKYQKLFVQIMDDLLLPQSTATPISTYNLIDQNQGRLIQALCNPNFKSYPDHQTIHQRFEEQVLRTPDHVAIVCEDKQLTYSELNTEANRLAHYLTKQSMIRPDDLVLVCLERSEYTVITLLAVLKTGGAYVPVNPHYPDNRIAYILSDAKPSIALTNAKHTNKLQGLISNTKQMVSVIAIDNQIQQFNGLEEDENLNTAATSQHLAYVIYTSGTTGKPKGVLQQHNNVIRLFEATREWYQFNDHDVWTLFHSYVFDFSVWEIWGALFHGGKLIIPSTDQIRDLPLFYELCHKEKVTVLNLTPAVLYHFIQLACDIPDKKLTNLRYIVSGGDKLNLFKLSDWFELYGEQRPKVINMYGITETTVHVTYKEIQKATIGSNSLIGQPIPDQKIVVLDRDLNLLPVGAVGELYVGGAGLARGYLNQPELTKEKFIPNHFQTDEEKLSGINLRLYKTGDLVRILPDGSLEYIGRVDTQLKIRGYRIEAGEIETLLCAYPGIKQAVVLAVDYQEALTSSNDHRCQYKAASSVDLLTVPDSRNEFYQDQIDVQNQPGMLPIQEWFFAQNFKNVHHFNQSFLIKTPPLNVDILAASVSELVNQYDCFWLRYFPKSGVMQSNYVRQKTQSDTIHQLDIRTIPYSEGTKEFNDKLYEILTDWQTNFNIVDGPLYSTGYISGYKDGSTRVYLAMHHLIVDVVSWHILVHGLQKVYNALSREQPVSLSEQPKKSSPISHHDTSYQQWVNLVRSYGLHNTKEKEYWLNVLEGHNQFDTRLTKLAESNSGTYKWSKPVNTPISFTINKNDSESILLKGKQVFRHQVNTILLTALGMTLKELLEDSKSGSNDAVNSIYVTVEGHGREDIHSKVDISHTPGWFTTMYPCKLTVEATNPLEIIKTTQQTLDAVPVNGLGYGALFGYSHGLPRVRFNYLGQLNNQDEHSYWGITSESSGQSVDSRNENSNVIDWVCWVANGQLEFTLISQLDLHQTNQLVEIFKAKLITLIKLISQQDGKDQTWGNNKLEKSCHAVESTTRLVAYCASDTPLEKTAISKYLSQHLPSYSVPQDFIWLEMMPLTVNGKIDVDALPKENRIDGEWQVLPRNERENLLCEAFAKVLHKKKIGIYDDFFLIGGDSISAITLVMHLQRHFQVNVRDIYNYRTPSQLAEKLTFSSKTIKNKLLEIMHGDENYSNLRNDTATINNNLKKYLSSSEKIAPDISPKKIKNVLLTGSTGYLGCNLLNQLLTSTGYNIYLLVRAESDQLALERVNNKYQRYFFSSLPESIYKNRVFVVCADLEKADFGLSRSRYSELTKVIDSVIHSAAIVKQFGDADLFYKANVQATINLLEFTKLTALKDFHHISTASVLKNNSDSFKQWGNYCTEEHLPENLQLSESNIYLQTKLEAERHVVSYRDGKFNANIYRVGNLAFMLRNISVQENISTVGFTHWLNYFFKSGTIFPEVKTDLSPVDSTANAIVKLFDKNCSNNSVYHVFNAHPFDLVQYTQYDADALVKVLPVPVFIQHVIDKLEGNTADMDSIMRFLLAQGWLDVAGADQFAQIKYLQNKTQSILKQLNFEWPTITNAQFKKYLGQIFT